MPEMLYVKPVNEFVEKITRRAFVPVARFNEMISEILRFYKATTAVPELLFCIIQEPQNMPLRKIDFSRAVGDKDKLPDTLADLVCHGRRFSLSSLLHPTRSVPTRWSSLEPLSRWR